MKVLKPVGTGILALLPVAIVALLLVAPAPVQPEPTAFGPGSANLDAWRQNLDDGGHEVRAVLSDSGLALDVTDPESTLLVVPQPRQTPTADQQHVWHTHLQRGGSLLLLDGAGVANPFLASFQAAITSQRVLDSGQEDPRTVHLSADVNGRGFETVGAFSPAAIVIDDEAGWTHVLVAPGNTYLDLQGNGRVDRADIPGPHIVGAMLQQPSGGSLVVVATTTPLSDRFLQDSTVENRAFANALGSALVGAGGVVLFDESHHGWTRAEGLFVSVVHAGLPFVTAEPWVIAAGLFALVALSALLVVRLPAMRPYRSHELIDNIAEPPESDAPGDEVYRDMAWELAALSNGKDVESLKKQGTKGIPSVVRSDGLLSRVINGEPTPEDKIRLMQRYLSDVNNND